MSRGRGDSRYRQNLAAHHREALEWDYETTLTDRSELAELVVARGARSEPYHRWFAYRQGFSPELVRRFLRAETPRGPVLDPFSGAGTVAIECARQGVSALGGDAVAALAFLLAVRNTPRDAEPFAPEGAEPAEWVGSADTARRRALVLLVEAARHDGEGHQIAASAAPIDLLRERQRWMDEDTEDPLRAPLIAYRGDARRLPLAEGTVGGVLTSPPYLSRYDYARVNAPIERLFSKVTRRSGVRRAQFRASRGTSGVGRAAAELHPAADEAASHLTSNDENSLARAVRGYFADLGQSLSELARVTRGDAPVWIVVAGADLGHVYIPSDLILADLARARGFRLEGLDVARRLRPSGRRLGHLTDVAPRETLVRLRRTSDADSADRPSW